MNKDTYISTSATVFAVVALVHLYRAIAGLPVAIGSVAIPLWISWLVVVLIGFLAFSGLKLRKP